MLAPPKWKVFSSYIIGWLTSLAWIATIATETIFAGTILQGLVILNNDNGQDDKLWQGTLLAWLVVAVAIFVNVVIPGALPKIEIFDFRSASNVQTGRRDLQLTVLAESTLCILSCLNES